MRPIPGRAEAIYVYTCDKLRVILHLTTNANSRGPLPKMTTDSRAVGFQKFNLEELVQTLGDLVLRFETLNLKSCKLEL